MKLNIENERFIVGCSRCRSNLKFDNFTLSFGSGLRQRIVLRAACAVRLLFFIQPITSLFELSNGFMHPAGVGRALMVVHTPHVGIKLWYIYPKAPNL